MIVALVFLITALFASTSSAEPIHIAVSILPQKFFVERIGGDQVKVQVMVGPGQSPATYEPTAKQLGFLKNATVYHSMDLAFERRWLKAIESEHPHLRVIHATDGLPLRAMRSDVNHHGHHDHGDKDPHVWTDPLLVKTMMRRFTDAIKAADGAHAEQYEANYQQFAGELDELDRYIKGKLATVKHRVFMVHHPSWGYFADRYNLKQIAIEQRGKEPAARQIARLINYAKAQGINVIFVQSQFSQRQTRVIADSVGARVVSVDPLAEDYINNLRRVCDTLAESMT